MEPYEVDWFSSETVFLPAGARLGIAQCPGLHKYDIERNLEEGGGLLSIRI